MESIEDYLKSAPLLLKALKSSIDPPQPGWPVKIEIARRVWSASEVYIPRKAEVIRDWIMNCWTRAESS
jgi:hypothetical protein